MYIFYISKYLDAHRLLIEFHVQNILDIPTVKLYIFTVHHYTEYYTYVNIIYIYTHVCVLFTRIFKTRSAKVHRSNPCMLRAWRVADGFGAPNGDMATARGD